MKQPRHPLHDDDWHAVAGLRQVHAPFKDRVFDTDERGPFDEIAASVPVPEAITFEAEEVAGVPGWWCRAERQATDCAVVYLHGGGYVMGSAEAYRHFAGHLASRTRADVFVANYRLAPEHPYPAALDDAEAVYRTVAARGMRAMAVGGDSAGGGLALAVAAASMAGEWPPRAVFAISPWVDLALTSPTLESRAKVDVQLTRTKLSHFADLYLGQHPPLDPRVSPVYGSLVGLPPVRIDVGSKEVLLDDSIRYATRALEHGVDAQLHIWDGMPHVFPINLGMLHAARSALNAIAHFVRRHLDACPAG